MDIAQKKAEGTHNLTPVKTCFSFLGFSFLCFLYSIWDLPRIYSVYPRK